MSELWAWIPGFDGLYQVSTRGRIISHQPRWKQPRQLKPTPARNGYLRVRLWRDGACRVYLVHRIVLAAFVGPCPGDMESRHLNGMRADNRLDNLVYSTRSVNALDRTLHGTAGRNRGSRHGRAKLTEDAVIAIRDRYSSGEMQTALAREYGVSQQTVGRIVRRTHWRHV